MENDIFGMIIWSAGFLAIVNVVLLIVGLVQKKLSAVETIIIIVLAFFLPIIGFFLGLTVDDNAFAGVILSILGMMIGFAVAMWAAFIFLLIKLIRKPKERLVQSQDTLDNIDDVI